MYIKKQIMDLGVYSASRAYYLSKKIVPIIDTQTDLLREIEAIVTQKLENDFANCFQLNELIEILRKAKENGKIRFPKKTFYIKYKPEKKYSFMNESIIKYTFALNFTQKIVKLNISLRYSKVIIFSTEQSLSEIVENYEDTKYFRNVCLPKEYVLNIFSQLNQIKKEL